MPDPTIHCAACGKAYGLTPAYVAQFGGQVTQCACGAILTIPAALPGAVPSYGAYSPPLPGQVGPVLGYATPGAYQQASQSGGVWREGDQIMMHKLAMLPYACIKCGGEPDPRHLRKKFYWHHPALALLAIPGLLLYAIVAMCVQKSAEVTIPLCPLHRSRRLTFIWTAWGIVLAGVACFFLAGALGSGWPAAFGGLLILGAAIFAVVAVPVLKPKRIDDTYAWFKGAGRVYLDQLPSSGRSW